MSNAHVVVDPPAEYGFQGRLSADFPSQILVDLTEVCNLACIHCPHPAFKVSAHYSASYLDPELNAKMVGEVRSHGSSVTQYIRYTGNGEPLIHPKAYDIIEYAVRYSGVPVTLTTNGTIMNERRTRRLLEAGVHMIDVSIDAFTPETYARIRVGGDLAVTRANVLRLIAWAKERRACTKIIVSFVEQEGNRNEVAEFKAFWTDHGADDVAIRRFHSSAGAVIPIAKILRSRESSRSRYPCLYPWERVTLDPTGFLQFCPVDWSHSSKIADYRSTTIRDVWAGTFYAALRKAHLDNNFSAHSFCGQCPDWQQTRWPNQGRSYADIVSELVKSN